MVKQILLRHYALNRFVAGIFRVVNFSMVRIKGKNNRVQYDCTYAKRCRIEIVGANNTIEFQGTNYLQNCKFHIYGSGNRIVLQDLVCAYGAVFCIEDNDGKIRIGRKTLMTGRIELAATEGAAITVGKDCLFSSGVDIRSGDSHSIFDNAGKRINSAKPVVIGDHVWVGRAVTILKGTKVGNGCVVGSGSVLTGNYDQENAVIAGVGAKVIKENIHWEHERKT